MRKTCINMVYELAKRDPRVMFIGSDLGPGVLDEMKSAMPDRFFMEGVAEQHVIGMAAGLAFENYVPYVNTIATFLTRRCFEQVAVDLCLHNLPVRLIANGGGLVYAPLGPTHLAIEDIAIMRSLPNMTIVSPVDAEEMERFMEQSLNWDGPIYIRLGKGYDPIVSKEQDGFAIGKAILLREPGKILFVSTGVAVNRCLKAAEILDRTGLRCGVLNMHTVKPLDATTLRQLAGDVELLVTVEEHVLAGGLGSAVLETLADDPLPRQPKILRLGIPDVFPAQYGSQDSMMESFGIQPEGITASVTAAWQQGHPHAAQTTAQEEPLPLPERA